MYNIRTIACGANYIFNFHQIVKLKYLSQNLFEIRYYSICYLDITYTSCNLSMKCTPVICTFLVHQMCIIDIFLVIHIYIYIFRI